MMSPSSYSTPTYLQNSRNVETAAGPDIVIGRRTDQVPARGETRSRHRQRKQMSRVSQVRRLSPVNLKRAAMWGSLSVVGGERAVCDTEPLRDKNENEM